MPTADEWTTFAEQLREPLDPSEVDFRVQGDVDEANQTARVVAYIDARAVDERLDTVVGVGNWSFEWEPLLIEKGEVQIAKGTITIFGVSKSDVGTASNTEPSKGCVSDALKRAAARWGIGRYLYGLRSGRAAVKKYGRSWAITDEALRGLRAKLPRPGTQATRRAPEVLPEAEAHRDAAQQAPRQLRPNPVADLAAQIVRSEDQSALCDRLRDVCNFSTTAQVDTWLNQHIRPEADPRGPIDALKLRSGGSNMTIAELKVANERLDKAAAKHQPALASAPAPAQAGR